MVELVLYLQAVFLHIFLPIPAEQCMTFGERADEGCIDVTVFKNFKNVVVEAGTPKSGHVK